MNVKREKGNTDLLCNSLKERINQSLRETLKKGQWAVGQENHVNIMLDRPSEEMSSTLQEIRERKVWSTGTTNYASTIERTVCITEIKMKHYQKVKSAWVLLEKTKAQCYPTTTTTKTQTCKPTKKPKDPN